MLLAVPARGLLHQCPELVAVNWTEYMEASEKLRRLNYIRVTGMARVLAKQRRDGRFPA